MLANCNTLIWWPAVPRIISGADDDTPLNAQNCVYTKQWWHFPLNEGDSFRADLKRLQKITKGSFSSNPILMQHNNNNNGLLNQTMEWKWWFKRYRHLSPTISLLSLYLSLSLSLNTFGGYWWGSSMMTKTIYSWICGLLLRNKTTTPYSFTYNGVACFQLQTMKEKADFLKKD